MNAVLGKRKPDIANKAVGRRRAPAKSLESRENQLIGLAVNLAEQQLAEGTASPSVITHYLKLGTTRERLEKEKLEKENKLLTAKTEALASAKRVEELYSQALDAMKNYGMRSFNEEVYDE